MQQQPNPGKKLLVNYIIKLFIYFTVVFFLFRVVSSLLFMPASINVFPFIGSFLLGFIYDAKWVAILLLPIISLGSFFSFLNMFGNKFAKWFWIIYLVLGSFLYLFMFCADFGHFGYVGTRLNASALNFFEDPNEMIGMLFETYPMPLILLSLLVVLFFVGYLFLKLYNAIKNAISNSNIKPIWVIIILAFFIYGKPWVTPLKRSDAMVVFNNKFNAYLALNPMQNFFTTLQMRNPILTENNLSLHKNFIQNYFGVINNTNNITRVVTNKPLSDTPINIVIVLCESLSGYKTSLFSSPLNSTPFLKTLSSESVFYTRAFTPHFGTARGLFALTTGIPDVQLSKFSSRNEGIINSKPCLLNELKQHDKYYFLGGSASFNNFKGIVNNINNVKILERGSFCVPDVNTWGISDKQLFLAANSTFKNSSKPFAAIIQTSQNHRPYTVSKDDSTCNFKTYPNDSLKKYGFGSKDEYNAMQLFDYSVQQFIEAAKKETYFNNTLFVFIGDHGIPGNASATFPPAWTTDKLSEEHVPLLFYCPKYLQPKILTQVVSQIDVLPTALTIAGYSYTNTTMGRNVYNQQYTNNLAMIIYHDEGDYGIVSDSTYYIKSIDFKTEKIVPTIYTAAIWSSNVTAALKAQYNPLADNYLAVARWCLVNTKR